MRLVAVLLLVLAGDAAAGERRAPAEIRAVLPGATLATSTLIGRSGQRFVPRAGGGWIREDRGGIGCDVRDAFELSGTLWAVCSWAPLFSNKDGVWSARPLTNRGRTRVARAGNDVVLSIGRHVYTWSGGDWKRRSSAPGRIKSLQAESPSQLFAVTTRGGLIRASGNRWRQVVDPPGRREKNADPPARVFGSTKHSYAISEAGVLSLIGSSLSPVKLPDGASAIDIGATAARKSGAVIAAAVITRGAKREAVLATLDGSTLSLAPLPEALAAARISLVFELGGELLVTSAAGRAFVRDASGAWSEKPLINELPSPKKATAANGGPALSK